MPRPKTKKVPAPVPVGAPPVGAVDDTATFVAPDADVIEASLSASEAIADLPTINPDTLVEVWERRFQNPGAVASTPVRLKVQGMVVRWINTAIEGRHHRAVYDQGWQPVPLRLLSDPEDIPDLYKHPHGIVARGERGKEVLMMMPADVYKKIQWRKTELNNKALRNIRQETAAAVGARYGDEAGEFARTGATADGNIRAIGTINFGSERRTVGEE